MPGKLSWIAVHWIMLESAQNWSPNGMQISTGQLDWDLNSYMSDDHPEFEIVSYSNYRTIRF